MPFTLRPNRRFPYEGTFHKLLLAYSSGVGSIAVGTQSQGEVIAVFG